MLKHNNDANIRKNMVVQEHFDAMIIDMIALFEESYGFKLSNKEKSLFTLRAKGILTYWVGLVYDEAYSTVKDLESALDASQFMVKKLRAQSEPNLNAIKSSIDQSNKDSKVVLTTKTENNPQKENKIDISSEIPDLTYRFIDKNYKKNPNKP